MSKSQNTELIVFCLRAIDFDEFNELPEKLQDAIRMRAFGNNLNEIAQTEVVSVGAIRHRIHRGCARLGCAPHQLEKMSLAGWKSL